MKGPERDRQKRITDALELYQWLWCHFRPAYTAKGYRTAIEGHKGFPDIVAVKYGLMLLIEVKRDKGRLSPEQEVWLQRLAEVSLNTDDGEAEAGPPVQYWFCDSDDTETALLSLISGGRLT